MNNLKFIISLLFLAFILVSAVSYNIYSLILNDSGHTGVNILKVKVVYFLFATITLFLGIIFRFEKRTKIIFFVSAIIAFLFVMNIWVFEELEIMLFYYDWLEKDWLS